MCVCTGVYCDDLTGQGHTPPMCALAPSSAADICDMSSFGQPTAQQRAAFTYIELFAGIGGFRGGPSTQWADAASSPQKSTASPETHPPLRRATDNESRQVASRCSSFWASNNVFPNANIGQASGDGRIRSCRCSPSSGNCGCCCKCRC
jgi:hypothetical protein